MNVNKMAYNGYTRQSQLLLEALELCDSSNRRSLGELLGSDGVGDSRWPAEEEWSESVGGIIFKLRPNSKNSGSGWDFYFHRLMVVCPVCALEIPVGRLHQHARTHVRTRLHQSEVPLPKTPTVCIWYKKWHVDEDGLWHRMPSEFQYNFPQRPGGF